MASTRLPRKVLLNAEGKPMLQHLVERLRAVDSISEIVLATTTNYSDNVLEDFAISQGLLVYRGSEMDVMGRVIGAAQLGRADVVVEITGDCPIIDPDIVEQTIQMYLHNDAVYVSNGHIRSYPDGMDTQVFGLDVLLQSAAMTNAPLDREHVSLHIRNNPALFPKLTLIAPPSLYWPELGLTLDEEADYLLLKKVIENLSPENPLFSCLDVVRFLKKNPDLVAINQSVVRKGDT